MSREEITPEELTSLAKDAKWYHHSADCNSGTQISIAKIDGAEIGRRETKNAVSKYFKSTALEIGEELKSYFVIDINGKDENDASGPFDTKAEAEEMFDLVANVKRIGALVITECERIEELQLLDVPNIERPDK